MECSPGSEARTTEGWTGCQDHMISMMNDEYELDLAFNNVKPKDWYFVLE